MSIEAMKQKPVAWMHPNWPNYTGHTSPVTTYMVNGWTPLYTTPPAAQRQWVGLTDEEIHDAVKACNTTDTCKYFRAIEAKLKEKNSGQI